MTENLAGDWKLTRLLDELWLRVRRALIVELDQHGFWIEKSRYEEFLEQQKSLGCGLRDRLLPAALGGDYLCLNSERLYGGMNGRVRGKIPQVMAFGFALCDGLASPFQPDPERARKAAALCALFNLGVSLFDILIDQAPELMETFAVYFNESTLRSLGADRERSAEVHSFASQVENDEIRILLKVIAAVFEGLHELSAGPLSHSRDLLAQLEGAYFAEMASSKARHEPNADVCRISKVKSAMPFDVMGQIAQLGAHRNGARSAVIPCLAGDIGEIFWLTDDLIDIVDDLRSCSVNAILAEQGLTPAACQNPDCVYRGVMQLLSGSQIESRAADVRSRVATLVGHLYDSETSQFKDCMLSYVRCWIT
jgi:hypothetical protein